MLETERLFLKPVAEEDLQELLEMQWDKSLMRFMNFKPLSMENQREWIKSLGRNNMAFSIFLKKDKESELIGLTTLNQIDHVHQRASWGMKLKANLQSKGIGFEASVVLLHYGFSVLNLHKIHGDIILENIANRRMCEKLGAREEGVLIHHYFQHGRFRDVVLVGILRDEFNEKNNETLQKLGLLYE